ncbi:MAG: oligosaccharide flippase family protein [Hyphomicrobiales bacterium]|nr:oligosaccharide flippase family protein [Hyphomicrobiales bacterium]
MADAPPIVGLRARIVNAGLWTVTGHVVETLIRLGTSLVMTRLLVPGDFGLMALALTIPTSLALLSDLGIHSNVIRKSGRLGSDFLRTAWTLQVARGILLCVIVLAFAGLLCLPQVREALPGGSLLLHPDLPSLLAVMGLIPALAGPVSVNFYVQERNIHFRPLVLRGIISKLLPVPVMVIWALLYPSVWSLVAGGLLGQALITLSSHIMIPGSSMKFRWDWHHVRDLIGDGKWIALATAGTFVITQGDRLILAALFSATQMGFYAIAWALADVARSFLQRLHGSITLPVLSELFLTRPERAVQAYYRYRRPIDILAFTGTGFIWMAGPEIIHFLYDDRYAEAGWILQVLSLSLASIPFSMINVAFVANDEWRNSSVYSLMMTVSFFAATYVGYALSGSTGVIWAIALYNWPATLILLARAYRRGWIDPLREIAMLPFALVGLALGFAGEWILQGIGVML